MNALNRRAQLAGIWCGPVAGFLLLVGVCLLARWAPPWVHPDDSAAEVASTFSDNATRIRAGTVIGCFGCALFAPWGIAMAAQVRRHERGAPMLAHLLTACTGIAVAILVVTCCLWAAAVFRPDDQDPEITRAINDIAWMVFLVSGPPFSVWTGTLAFAILADDETPVYPRWVGYLSAWVALLIVPAVAIAFFKHGALSWAGVLALYVPFAAFFAWLIVTTRFMLRNVARHSNDRVQPGSRPQAPR